MPFVLKSNVVVSAEDGELLTLYPGTELDELSDHVKNQLAPEHFVDEDGSDKLPKDWRDMSEPGRLKEGKK